MSDKDNSVPQMLLANEEMQKRRVCFTLKKVGVYVSVCILSLSSYHLSSMNHTFTYSHSLSHTHIHPRNEQQTRSALLRVLSIYTLTHNNTLTPRRVLAW